MSKEIKMDTYKCKRCMHNWYPRKQGIPVICPKCKSPYWDKERILSENNA